jgi:hypothetical protein
MVKTQRYFSKLVSEKTGGEVEIRFLEGKSLPVFRLASMVKPGDTIDAANVPGFFLVKVPELEVQAIPYLFEGLEHARRFPRSKAAEYLAEKIEKAYEARVVSFFKIASTAIYHSMAPIHMPADFAGKNIANIWALYGMDMCGKHRPALLKEVSFTEAMAGGMFTGEFNVAPGYSRTTVVNSFTGIFPTTRSCPFYTISTTPLSSIRMYGTG